VIPGSGLFHAIVV